MIAAARVVFNIKARMTRETTWSLELKGELTKQRRVEAVDKLLTVLTLLVASVFGLQAIGLDGEALTFHIRPVTSTEWYQQSHKLLPVAISCICAVFTPGLCPRFSARDDRMSVAPVAALVRRSCISPSSIPAQQGLG